MILNRKILCSVWSFRPLCAPGAWGDCKRETIIAWPSKIFGCTCVQLVLHTFHRTVRVPLCESTRQQRETLAWCHEQQQSSVAACRITQPLRADSVAADVGRARYLPRCCYCCCKVSVILIRQRSTAYTVVVWWYSAHQTRPLRCIELLPCTTAAANMGTISIHRTMASPTTMASAAAPLVFLCCQVSHLSAPTMGCHNAVFRYFVILWRYLP